MIISNPNSAIDLGCGTGRDTLFLATNRWQVTAVDAEKNAEEFLFSKVPNENHKDVNFITSKFESFDFSKKVMLINASYSLLYCHPDRFDEVMEQITSSILPRGRFSGNFFGSKDGWADEEDVTIVDRSQIESYFKDFEIEYFEEELSYANSLEGPKYWHIFHIVAKKV